MSDKAAQVPDAGQAPQPDVLIEVSAEPGVRPAGLGACREADARPTWLTAAITSRAHRITRQIARDLDRDHEPEPGA